MSATSLLAVLVPLIGVLVVGVLVPVLLLSRTEKHRIEDQAEAARLHREDRDAEWARQDAVAAKAATMAENVDRNQKLIARQAAEAAELLLKNNEQVARTQQETNGKLDTIHTLVNSNMTAAMMSELDAVTRELAMMREVMELRRQGGQEPSTDTLAAIAATEAKMHELAAALADRAKAQEQVNKGTGLDVITTTSYRAKGAGESEA